MTCRAVDRTTGVKAYERWAGDQRVVSETNVEVGIGHDQYILVDYCMAAERDFPTGFARFKPLLRFEPLAARIHQADQTYFNTEETFRHTRNAVIAFFRSGVVVVTSGREGLFLVRPPATRPIS